MLNFAPDINGNYHYRILKVSGLWDWPSIKTEGVDWSDEDYTEISNRCQDFQYNSRIITLDCIISAGSWATVTSLINGAIGDLNWNGLELLVLPEYSQRGYLVRLQKTTIFEPVKYFKNGKCVAEFKLVFEEPQPFNIQWSFYFPHQKFEQDCYFSISAMSGLSTGSTDQKFVRVYFDGYFYDANLEQEDFIYDVGAPFTDGVPYPVIITGEIDTLSTISIEVLPGVTVAGINTADYFLRNGEILFTQL